MKMKRSLGILLNLALALGLMMGMRLTAYAAWKGDPYARLLNTTTVVKFDSRDWYLIEDNSTALNAGTVTLLAKKCVGVSEFGSNNTYEGSLVEAFVRTWYAQNITANAKTAVNGEGMFLLTTAQVNSMIMATRKCPMASGASLNCWWLRSPGDNGRVAAVYGVGGGVFERGKGGLMEPCGVRPALKLNLESVVFDPESNTFSLLSFPTVGVSGITLDKDAVTLTVGDTETLTATVSPDDATNKMVTVSWTGEAVDIYADEACTQALTNGETYAAGTFYVKGLAVGSSTIAVTTADGAKTATCTVTVEAYPLRTTPIVRTGGWRNDYTVVTTADFPWFSPVTLEQVKSWTGAPTDDFVYVIYEIGGDVCRRAVFSEGIYMCSEELLNWTRNDFYQSIDVSHLKFYYTWGEKASAPTHTWNHNADGDTDLSIVFDANEGTGTMDAMVFERGSEVTLAACAFTREGYEFTGWNTAADGSGTAYADGATLTLEDDMLLFAQWKKAEGANPGDNPKDTNPGNTNPKDNPEDTDPGNTDPEEEKPEEKPEDTNPGNTNPGNTDPGNTDPGNTDPGNTDPGNTDPGNTDPGNTNPEDKNPEGDPEARTPTHAPAETTPTPAAKRPELPGTSDQASSAAILTLMGSGTAAVVAGMAKRRRK